MTDIDVYQSANKIVEYQAGIVMTPDQARAMDEQVRRCTQAVLREGTDYGVIPGTGGEKSLWRPGAQKLLQWFRLGYTCERTEIERDDQGRKHGITYRAEVKRRHPDGSYEILATCEGTADYDESKFFKDAEQVRREAEARERKFARIDGRSPSPAKWTNLPEYRADWNSLMKRAQKRAIVGAVVDATAAGGIFTDREEDDAPVITDDGPTWTEIALGHANTFTDIDDGRALYLEAAAAHKDGRCSRRQQDLIQNTVTKRAKFLQSAVVVEAEDLASKAEADHAQDAAEDSQDTSGPAPSGQPAGDEPAAGPEDTLPVEDPPEWPETVKPGTGTPKGK